MFYIITSNFDLTLLHSLKQGEIVLYSAGQ